MDTRNARNIILDTETATRRDSGFTGEGKGNADGDGTGKAVEPVIGVV